MPFAPPARHLLRAKDLADARYFEPLGVAEMARAAGLSRAHFSREAPLASSVASHRPARHVTGIPTKTRRFR